MHEAVSVRMRMPGMQTPAPMEMGGAVAGHLSCSEPPWAGAAESAKALIQRWRLAGCSGSSHASVLTVRWSCAQGPRTPTVCDVIASWCLPASRAGGRGWARQRVSEVCRESCWAAAKHAQEPHSTGKQQPGSTVCPHRRRSRGCRAPAQAGIGNSVSARQRARVGMERTGGQAHAHRRQP